MNNCKIDRRNMLKASAGVVLSSMVPLTLGFSGCVNSKAKAIVNENSKPGTRDWILKKEEILFDKFSVDNLWMGPIRSRVIEGYCDKLYVVQGGEISFHVSSSISAKYRMDIYRIGYYQGNGGRLIKSIDALQGRNFGTPDYDKDTFLIECDWESAYTLKVPKDWVSGFYVVKLITHDGWSNYMSFVVVDEDPHDLVFQVSDFNSHAYNRWPEHHSLYNNIDTGIDNYWGPRNMSSFRRPQGKLSQLVDLPLTLGAGEFFAFQYPFVFWAARMGYDITYLSNMTLHESGPEVLTRSKGFLSVGHDEYWTDRMYENAVSARDKGVSLGSLCGNAVFSRFQLSEGLNGGSNMRYKRNGRLNDSDLMGSGSGKDFIGGVDWIVKDASHWAFSGTGMKDGDAIEGIIGWEAHNEVSKKIVDLK